MQYLAVFIGGGLGSLIRFFISKFGEEIILTYPISTLISNAISSFILGYILALLSHRPDHDLYKLFIAVGFCGGFSTFSTFSYETFHLMQQGDYITGISHIFLNLLICIGFITFGVFLGK